MTKNMSSKPPLHVFYHIYCNPNTLSVVQDQVTKIVYSGLYDAVTAIHCFLVGDTVVLGQVVEFLESSGGKFQIRDISADDNTYERFTLLRIQQYVHLQDFVLYIHTKGVTKTGEESRCCEDWRHFMEYYLIGKYQECVQKLVEGYETVGANLQMDPALHYSGNFWWCRAEYFLSLDPKNLERLYYGSNYLACEMYILSGTVDDPTKKVYEIAKSTVTNHYLERFPWALYIDANPSLQHR
jgi:hypothetical protein